MNNIEIKSLEPHKIEYYEYIEQIEPYLVNKYPVYKEEIETFLKDSIWDYLSFNNGSIMYLNLDILKSFLPKEDWSNEVIEGLKEIFKGKDGFYISFSW